MDRQEREKASELRREIVQSQTEGSRHLERILAKRSLLGGSLYEWKRRCGAKSCRCRKGVLHSSWILSYRQDGKLRKKTIPAEEVSRYQVWVQAYRDFRADRAGLVKVHANLCRLLRELEEELMDKPPWERGKCS